MPGKGEVGHDFDRCIICTHMTYIVSMYCSTYLPTNGRRLSRVQPLYRTQKKSLLKRVFNFGSVRQDLGAANQIAEQCLRHGLYLKKIVMLT